jgi:hypothetical protein
VLLNLYCKLSPLNYPDFSKVSMYLHDVLVSQIEEHKCLPLEMHSCYILVKSLSKKRFMAYVDKKIFELVLVDMQIRQMQFNINSLTRFGKALVDLDVSTFISNNQIVVIVDRILLKTVRRIRRGVNIDNMYHLAQCPLNNNRYHNDMMQLVYAHLISCIK